MARRISVVVALISLFAPLAGHANECWSVSNIKGYAAYSDEGYKFSPDGLRNTILVCFGSDSGVVTGTDTKFVKFGESTLVGLGGNNQGNEVIEVYQLDRAKKKLLYMKSRVGTKTVVPLFSDVVLSFIGDATQSNK
ncbi:hypothetical protein [Thiobacillus sp.]